MLRHVGLEAPRNSLDLQVQTPQNYCTQGELSVYFLPLLCVLVNNDLSDLNFENDPSNDGFMNLIDFPFI